MLIDGKEYDSADALIKELGCRNIGLAADKVRATFPLYNAENDVYNLIKQIGPETVDQVNITALNAVVSPKQAFIYIIELTFNGEPIGFKFNHIEQQLGSVAARGTNVSHDKLFMLSDFSVNIDESMDTFLLKEYVATINKHILLTLNRAWHISKHLIETHVELVLPSEVNVNTSAIQKYIITKLEEAEKLEKYAVTTNIPLQVNYLSSYMGDGLRLVYKSQLLDYSYVTDGKYLAIISQDYELSHIGLILDGVPVFLDINEHVQLLSELEECDKVKLLDKFTDYIQDRLTSLL